MRTGLNVGTRRLRRRPMAEINVVPYIDVMLVLLVIFMVTAPLLYQGVEIELPQAGSEPLPQEEREPVIVEIDREGNFYTSVGDEGGDEDEPVSAREVVVTVTAIMREQPDTRVLVRGDQGVPYGRVIEIMSALKEAGVPQVGLMTQPPAER